MQEKKYLKWYHKVGYGSGDIAGNCVYALLTAFMMIYLTDTVGLSMGVVSTLIAASKIFDGVTDFFFGRMIDKTNTRMGKARPWMLWPYIGCAITLVACFSIPTSWGQTAQYIFFFLSYTLLNAVFYTANNIAYASLTALITKNTSERVQIGSLRFIFAFATKIVIEAVTIFAVTWLGGGVAGWRAIAIIYAVIGLITNTISVFSVKELPEADEELEEERREEHQLTFLQSFKFLLKNKYYVIICSSYILTQLYASVIGMGTYYAKYILGNEEIFSTLSLAINITMVVALTVLPVVIKKLGGMYKLRQTWCDGGRLYGKPSSDACVYRPCHCWHRPSSGRPQCADCVLLRIHHADNRPQTGGYDVLLLLSGYQGRRRTGNRNQRLAFGCSGLY